MLVQYMVIGSLNSQERKNNSEWWSRSRCCRAQARMDIDEGDSGVERSTRMPSLAVDPSVTPRLDDMLPGQSHSKLCIGDTIALCLQRDERLCFVGSEGFVELGSSLREFDLSRPVPWTHVDCLWVVEQKHQYDAQKALHKSKRAQTRASPSMHAVGANVTRHASETFASTRTTERTNKFGGVGQVSEMMMAKHSKKAQEEQARQRREHAELLAAVKSERVSNDARNEEKRGVPLTYGETVQLRHLKSCKYLIVNPKRRSQSLGCYSVRLDAEGSEDAWLAITPRHSFQFEGAPVYNHDLITMHSNKRQLWLHVGRTCRSIVLRPFAALRLVRHFSLLRCATTVDYACPALHGG